MVKQPSILKLVMAWMIDMTNIQQDQVLNCVSEVLYMQRSAIAQRNAAICSISTPSHSFLRLNRTYISLVLHELFPLKALIHGPKHNTMLQCTGASTPRFVKTASGFPVAATDTARLQHFVIETSCRHEWRSS